MSPLIDELTARKSGVSFIIHLPTSSVLCAAAALRSTEKLKFKKRPTFVGNDLMLCVSTIVLSGKNPSLLAMPGYKHFVHVTPLLALPTKGFC